MANYITVHRRNKNKTHKAGCDHHHFIQPSTCEGKASLEFTGRSYHCFQSGPQFLFHLIQTKNFQIELAKSLDHFITWIGDILFGWKGISKGGSAGFFYNLPSRNYTCLFLEGLSLLGNSTIWHGCVDPRFRNTSWSYRPVSSHSLICSPGQSFNKYLLSCYSPRTG